MFGRRRKQRENELARELHAHLELEAEEQQESGVTAEDARYAARRALGNATLIQEDTRAVWRSTSLDRFAQDVRFALRSMRKHPGVTAIALLTLALGTGANTAIFSVVNTVLLQPLPYRDAGTLMTVWTYNRSRGTHQQVSPLDFADWRSQNHVFEDMAASTDVMYTLTGSGEPLPIIGYRFSANFFPVLGVAPLLGRTFTSAEQQAGNDHVVVLGYALWQSRFNSDPAIIGKDIRLDGAPYTVIGVMPRGIHYPGQTQLWTPLVIPPEAVNDRGYRFLRILGRLRPGVTQAQAQAEMSAIAARLSREYPNTNKEAGAALVISVRERISGDIRPALLVLMWAVSFVLLIACANVANLLLVRAIGRRREVAIRTALGAGRARLVRQFLTEGIVLAVAGGALGVLLAWLSTKALVAMFPPTIANLSIPHVEEIPIDGWVLGFALLASLLTGAVLGLIPAFEAARADTNEPLKESSRSVAGTISGRRFRAVMVTVEVALSLTLLAAAGLTLKSFAHLLASNIGFSADNVLTLRLILPDSKYTTNAQRLAFGNAVLSRLQSVPGVESAGSVTFLPLSGWWGVRTVSRVGEMDTRRKPDAVWSSVTPDYFRALRIPLVAGRVFTQHDNTGSAPVAIISRALAAQLGLRNPVGERLAIDGLKSPAEVVGVVGDVHQLGLTSDHTDEVYLPFAQLPAPILCVAIHTSGDPAVIAKAAEQRIWQVDKDQAISYVMPMSDLVSESLAPQRVVGILLGVFAAMALLMAVVGIYGVISFAAAQRTHEIGVRMALGARSGDVLKLIAGQGLAPVLAGLALGLAATCGLTRYLSSLLYGVRPLDPFIIAAVALVLAASALLATYIPARRAMCVDPVIALRYE